MYDYFRGGLDARTFLDYVEHLPRTSAYHTAIAEDEELALQMLGQNGDSPAASVPRLAEFGPDVQALAAVYDLLASLIGVTIAMQTGKKPKKIKPYPRPESALDRVRRRERYAAHRSLVSRLLPRHE